MAFCLIPKSLNSVYVVMIFSKMCAVIEAKMAKFTDIKHIITTKGIRVHIGNYKGQSAVAIGLSKSSDNNRIIFKMSGSATTQGDYNIGAGIGYQW